MDKIFDHRYASKGWISVENAEKEIDARFEEEHYCDRDQATEYMIERWSEATDKITYYVADLTGWHYGEEPTCSVTYYGEEFPAFNHWKPTKLDPRRDYILINHRGR
jgi:hypothetical protein